MRAFLKNDLYYSGNLFLHQSKNKKKQTNNNNQVELNINNNQINNQIELEYSNNKFNASDAMKIQIHNKKQDIDIDDQLKMVFASLKSGKKTKQKDTPQKNTIFTPKCTLKPIQYKTQPDKQKMTESQEYKLQRKQKLQMWRMRQDLSKVIKLDEQQTKKNQQNKLQQQSNNEQKQKIQEQDQINEKQVDNQKDQKEKQQQQKQEQKAKTTGKKKKIKKQANYVKLDLKKKYRDRFVGGINKNLRMLTKGGKMKRSWGKNKLQTQLQLNQGQFYNSYTISLSKALFVTVDLQDDDASIVSQKQLKYQIPSTYTKQNLQKLIHDLFGFNSFREGQYQTTLNILQGKSTLFVSQTASGKSLTYLLASVILKGLSIVVSPLVSLMLDQIQHLPPDLPAACISSLLNHDQKDRIIKMVKQGKIQILYITPQSFLTDFMYHVREFPPINFVCVDQAHSMSQLSHSFRASYLSLEDIILKYFIYKSSHPVVLCLTATANIQTMQSICQKLNISQTIRSKSVINKNLFVTISRQALSSKYNAVLQYLNHPQIRKCKGILVYCRTKKIMNDVFNYLRNSGMLCFMYHSGLQQKVKVQTIQKFRRGQIRIVIATVALGMGLDFESLQCVIHINMPKSVENYIQQIGRAGRRQKRAYCHLFLDKFDYFTERNYFLADELQPSIFSTIINILKADFVDKRKKIKNKKANNSTQVQNLKRLTINEYNEQNNCQVMQDKLQEIYEEEEQQQSIIDKNVQNKNENQIVLQGEKIDNNLNKQQLKKQDKSQNKQQNKQQEKRDQQQIKQQQVIQNLQQGLQYKKLSFCRAEFITQKTSLKQEAILNILLKIQKKLTKQVFKVLPMSYQTLKISFFKKNQQQLKKQSQFYQNLISNCKIVKGTTYIPLIRKCNQLKMSPIRLLSEIYGISNKYWLKIQLVNQTFVWQHCKSAQHTFKLLENKQIFDEIMVQFNLVQRTALTKFNIFYSLCFNNSAKNIHHILQRNQIISDKDPLPKNSVIGSFDKYFQEETYKFYQQIIKQAEVQSEPQGQKQTQNKSQHKKQHQSIIQSGYLPITSISQQNIPQIQQAVQTFLKNHLLSTSQQNFIKAIAPYRDGRIITRVFLGVNDGKSNWKIYGQHPYWMKFIDKDYRELLKTVRSCIFNFITNQGIRLLNLNTEIVSNTKKQ